MTQADADRDWDLEADGVYVVKADMTAEVRKVVVTRTEGDMAVLAEGNLVQGEQVVVRGALRLAPGIKVNILDSAAAS